jgi:CheY-like chemotaxis protein
MNLLSNAIKFTDTGGVTFKVGMVYGSKQSTINNQQSTPNKIRFQVEDTGIGMTPDQLEKIFLPFEQVGDMSHRIEGTGLGLAITQRLISLMGSEIVVESTLGVGTTFWFDLDLPVSSNQMEPTPVKCTQPIIGYQGEKQKILVVDDHWENRSVILNILQPIGFELLEASHGQDALEKAVEFQPDLIITDLVMPEIDGFEMTKQLRQLPEFQNTIILATSASISELYQQKSLQSGCNDFLPKPIQSEELINKLNKYLILSWIYESQHEAQAEESFGGALTMVMPPVEELALLYESAQIGYVGVVQQEAMRIKQLAPEYATFATKVLEFAEEFEYEEIMKLVDHYWSEKSE